MTRLEFDQMVETLEERYKGRQQALTRVAVAWAVMGYAVLVCGFLGALGLAAGSAWMVWMAPNGLTIKLALMGGLAGVMMAWSILRGIWIRLEAPEGQLLKRSEVPRLFEMIDSISRRAGGVSFGRVLLTEDLNACVVQIPRLGVFGWYRNILCLGIQLMDALSPGEFQAVLAHEFAHLSKSHGRTGNWLYRVRRSWCNVAESLSSQGGVLVRPLRSFFNWFWPRFNARSFVLSRSNEYQADAFSAEIAGAPVAARALQRIAVEDCRLDEEFWGRLGEKAAAGTEVPECLYQDLADLLKTRPDEAGSVRWLGRHLATGTDTSDTHPGLRDRITALGAEPESGVIEVPEERASEVLLGGDFASVARGRFSRLWMEAHGENWTQACEANKEMRGRISRLREEPATDEGRWEILKLRFATEGVAAVLDELKEWIRTHPDHPVSRYVLGSYLLSEDDPAGVELLETVIREAPQASMQCFGDLAGYHSRCGDAAAVREIKGRADQMDLQMERAMAERYNLGDRDNFMPHARTEKELAAIHAVLSSHSPVAEAWLVVKRTREMPKWPHYVLMVRLKFPALKFTSDADVAGVVQSIANAVDLNGFVLVVTEKGYKNAAKGIKAVTDSGIYQK